MFDLKALANLDLGILASTARTRYGEIQNVNSGSYRMEGRRTASQAMISRCLLLTRCGTVSNFLFRQDPHASSARHNHVCTAVALTLEGIWGYREGEGLVFPGTSPTEPSGSAHTPYATGTGMVVYASFQGHQREDAGDP